MRIRGGEECMSPITRATASSPGRGLFTPNSSRKPKMRNLPQRVGKSAEATCRRLEGTKHYSGRHKKGSHMGLMRLPATGSNLCLVEENDNTRPAWKGLRLRCGWRDESANCPRLRAPFRQWLEPDFESQLSE